ncbi:MAG: hypothetical protein A2798_00430 [Candidatus Levybacteria bacterium RIFCSPHIGHO2_01_FULL_37_17]|nr:MAG: hypothetical protein A2798_00430 [Candidatus Levybacteria bacterium RIFCSPHIGHO2_01_FULL_37_17]OGH36447.1 MAG: hypothetical protein A2959_02935 [Candidatus Levybacteria bacterium RIFCSPLOWO2_01_FULL_38_23]
MKKLVLTIDNQSVNPPQAPTGGLSELANIIRTGIELAFFFAIIVAGTSLIFSGLQWMLSGGDKEKIQHARSRMTYAIVGLTIIFLSLLLVQFFGDFFGINILDFPTP